MHTLNARQYLKVEGSNYIVEPRFRKKEDGTKDVQYLLTSRKGSQLIALRNPSKKQELILFPEDLKQGVVLRTRLTDVNGFLEVI